MSQILLGFSQRKQKIVSHLKNLQISFFLHIYYFYTYRQVEQFVFKFVIFKYCTCRRKQISADGVNKLYTSTFYFCTTYF